MSHPCMPLLPHRLLAGISGGADSTALLHLLLCGGYDVTAVHVNHGLRGEASDGDEAFVRQLCDKLGVPLMVYRAEPPENPGEDWARQARMGFFREAMQVTGAEALALAHHRDDQAETLLMHLLRGAGLTGLCGMQPDAVVDGLRIVRPLLGYSRQELQQLLMEAGLSWREDASNADRRYLRNALRLDVLPMLEHLIPGAAERLAVTAGLLRADDEALNAQTVGFLARWGGKAYLPLHELRRQPLAIRRRILRLWWAQMTLQGRKERGLTAEQTESLISLLEASAGAQCSMPGGRLCRVGWTHLHLLADSPSGGISEQSLAKTDRVSVIERCDQPGDGATTQAIPRDMLPDLTVRSRRPGDWIIPFGSAGRQSLQDYFVNRHIDAPFRDRVPLVCRGSEVLLAGGVGAGNIPKQKNWHTCVLLRWNEEFPWQRADTEMRRKQR